MEYFYVLLPFVNVYVLVPSMFVGIIAFLIYMRLFKKKIFCVKCGGVNDLRGQNVDRCIVCTMIDKDKIKHMLSEGHPLHCVRQQLYGDGKCECGVTNEKVSM